MRWTRGVALDFPAGDDCPGEWTAEAEIAGCRRGNDGISSAAFPVPRGAWDEVLGRAVGRQKGSPDAFGNPTNIDEAYVDGLSLTARDNAGGRVHLWSFPVGLTETPGFENNNMCPCEDASTNTAPGFVGGDFFCESAGVDLPDGATPWLAEDLWDADALEGTCGGTAPAFFHQILDAPLASDIEGRLMADQNQANEDVGVRRLELYVR